MDNQPLIIKNILYNELIDSTVIKGQLIFTTDTRGLYFDDENLVRNNISSSLICFINMEALNNLSTVLINKLYMTLDTKMIYKNTSGTWEEVLTTDDILNVISDLSEYEISILTKNDKLISPATLVNQVYLANGSKLISAIDEAKKLTIVKTKAVYVQATELNQKVFAVPFPKDNFDFLNGDSMCTIRNSQVINTSNYVIDNGDLIFSQPIEPFQPGELLLFIFYYRMVYDLNKQVVLSTDNIEDGSITSPKISPYLRLEADKIVETVSRIFFTPTEKDKLKNIEEFATCYHHPDTHPATMIVQDELHRFISDTKILEYDGKANAVDVYTKIETEDLLNHLIDAAPGALDTLNELANALNDDPNFANTVSQQLALKATVAQFDTLSDEVDTKVAITDYVRSTIYDTPSHSTDTSGDLYTITVADPNLLEYIDGMTIVMKISIENIKQTSLRINALSSKKLLTQDQYELIQGELKAGSIYTVKYNGTTGNFILQGKGGVKLRDTLDTSYIVNTGEDIQRGDLVDIINDMKIMKSVPRTRILSRTPTVESKFECNGNIKLFKIDSNTLLVIWLKDNSLRSQVFILNDSFITLSSQSDNYVELADNCINFDGYSIMDNKVVISYTTSANGVCCKILTTTNNTPSTLNTYTAYEVTAIDKSIAIPLFTDKLILVWRCGNKTETRYLDISLTPMKSISSRSNIDYPIDKVCKISETQLLFTYTENNIIKAWTMAISDNDFFNSSINTLYSGTDPLIPFTDLSMTFISGSSVILTWLSGNTIVFNQNIIVNYDGGLTVVSIKQKSMTMDEAKSNKLPSQIVLNNDYFLSASLYDYYMPSSIGRASIDAVKITVDKIGSSDMYEVVDKITDVYELGNYISFIMISDSKLIVAFNYKESISSTMNKLYFLFADVRKLPNGVAIAEGKAGDTVKIQKW